MNTKIKENDKMYTSFMCNYTWIIQKNAFVEASSKAHN